MLSSMYKGNIPIWDKILKFILKSWAIKKLIIEVLYYQGTENK